MFDTQFNLYGFFILFSLVLYFMSACIISRKYKITLLDFMFSILYEFMFIIIGALSLTYFSELAKGHNGVIGLSSSGGAIGALIGAFFYYIIYKKNLNNFLTIYILPLPLAYGISKIGCYLVGCCYGIYYSCIGSTSYNYSLSAPNNISLFPVQLLEVFLNIFIFLYLMLNFYKGKNQSWLIANCFIITGLCKFLTDFLRFSHNNIFLSLNQYICLFFIILGIIIHIYAKKKRQ